MKRFYLILLGVSLLSLSSFAGSLFPTVITPNADVVNPIMWYGKIWNVRYDFIDDSHQSLVLYSDVTESIVDGKTYVPICVCERKLIVRGVTLRSDINQSEATRLLYRQEGDKVYYLSQENNAEFILFDYGLKEGEKFKAQDGEQYVVTETGYFEEYDKNIYAPGQNKPRMLRLRAEESGKEDVWIEGIGSVKWGIVPKYVLKASAVFKDTPIDAHVFRSSTNGDIAIYDYLFNINEENYKLINYELGEECSKEEDGLSFTFIEDTLCVSGAYCPYSSFGPECIECLVTSDNTIVMAFYGFHVITTNSTYRKIDVKIPGFKPGTYIFGTETLVCKGKDTNFYYYNGGKIPLTLNENKVVISVPKEYDETSERIQANAGVLVTISDSFFQSFVITRSDFEKLGSLDSWEEDEKSVILTSSYYTENNEEVYATPYLSVRLKKEEDIDLLASYVEKYKLRFGDYKPLLPLWYVLSVTLESEKSPLQIANELYETGDFVAAAPDLAQAPDGSDPDENYHPFVEEGKKWECTISWGLLETNTKKEYYSISGDTIVNGITCKKLHGPYSTYAVYEKDGKVYCHEKVNGDFHLLYDFTCHEGDVVNVVNPEGQTEWGLDEYRCTIKKVDTIITKSGHRLKRFTLQAENLEIEFGSEEEYVWIEGVGSPWEPLYPVGYWETAGGSSYLNACYVNGEQLFVGKDIYYGTGISPIQNSKCIIHNGADAIYDLSGRRVVNPKRGLYIQGGKRVLVK